MNIAVTAANGRLGRAFVKEALAAGHSVRAGVRGKNNFAPHPQLEVVVCDATQPNDLKLLFQGQEVVVSTIGHVKGSAPDVQTRATQAAVMIMEELHIKRYVDVTGTGVRLEGDKVTMIDRILNAAIEIIDPARVKDGRDHQQVLQASSLDWTTIRVLKLQNVSSKPFLLTLHGPTKSYVGRGDVAKAMVQVIEEGSFVGEMPMMSKV